MTRKWLVQSVVVVGSSKQIVGFSLETTSMQY
jgi:hypothetical protein